MKVGFTGTRAGMTRAQMVQLSNVIEWLYFAHSWMDERSPKAVGAFEFHHGAAVGADAEAAAEAELWGDAVAHPAGDDPLARNREIVDAVDVLVAAPKTDAEELRSGTWATVRYARKQGKPVIFLSRGETAQNSRAK